jgi:DNA-directed RNA polymerase specialized sigma24 family protein
MLNSCLMNDKQTDAVETFEHFIDLYFASVYSAVSRLTGLTDQQAVEAITVEVFVNLWKNSDTLFSEVRPPAFIYKIMLPHIFNYLKEHESENRAQLLKGILLIDPAYYEKGTPSPTDLQD